MAPAEPVLLAQEQEQQLQSAGGLPRADPLDPPSKLGDNNNAHGLVVDVNAEGGARTVDRYEPHPIQAAAAPTREQFAAEGPVIATGHPMLAGVQTMDGSADMTRHLPLNTRAFDVETALFAGRMAVSVRGTPTSAAAAAPGGPLACRMRTFHVAVQGRFKRPLAAADLQTGQEFPKAPRAPSLMHFIFSGAAKVFASTTEVFVRDGKPMHYYVPALAAAQVVNVARPGEEPPLLAATEDVSAWCPELRGKSADKRRRFFDTPANLAGREIGTDLVWTMHIFQSLVDFSAYKLGLPGVPVAIDLVPVLDAMPLQVMAKDRATGDYVFNVLMWSQRLLYEHADQQAAAAAAEGSSLKGRFKGLLGW